MTGVSLGDRWSGLADGLLLLRLSARSLAGRWFWAVTFLPLLWQGFLGFRLMIDVRPEYSPYEAQGSLIGVPLTVLAILLGVRVIAGELDRRTLEIAYTVPGGTHRVWLAKLAAAFLLLVLAEVWLAIGAFVFFTEFPPGALVGALQAATFYLALATWLAARFRSEVTGALVTAGVLTLNGPLTGFGAAQMRPSPFFNPHTPVLVSRYDAADIFAWTVQNRIGFLLAIVALIALAVARAERRERLLS